MLAELAVVLIILITIAVMYLKGSVIRAFLLLINTLVAATVAFAYFETLGQLIIGYEMIPEWAMATSLIVIFAITLAILDAIGGKLAPTDVYFGDFADRIIRALLAIFPGLAIAGVILIAAAMTPIGTKWPYERFAANASNPTEPDKTLILDADGFIASTASWLSRGSMSGDKSFAVFHPDFLNEIYLNRIGTDKDNSTVAGRGGISVESAWWAASELVSSSDNQPISQGSQTKAVIVRAKTDGVFSMAQVRLICKASDSAGNLTGGGQIVWPIGYITGENAVDRKNLSEKINLQQLDLVFFVPANTVPVMLEYKQNAATEVRVTNNKSS